MSKKFDNELRGVLFKNDNKDSEKHPDYKGSATIEGTDYFMDAWMNESESGKEYMSVRFKAKDKQSGNKKPAAKQDFRRNQEKTDTGFDGMDDDVPF